MKMQFSAAAMALCAAGAILVAAASVPAQAADLERGEALHEEHCAGCHGSEVYTRPNRRRNTLRALNAQVEMCNQSINAGLFDDEVADVAAYLNQAFYHLEMQ